MKNSITSTSRAFSSVDEMLVCMGLFGIALNIRRGKLMEPFAKSRGRQRQRHMRRAYDKALRIVTQYQRIKSGDYRAITTARNALVSQGYWTLAFCDFCYRRMGGFHRRV